MCYDLWQNIRFFLIAIVTKIRTYNVCNVLNRIRLIYEINQFKVFENIKVQTLMLNKAHSNNG